MDKLQGDISDLQKSLQGSVALPGSDSYKNTKTIFNASIDKKPRFVVYPECEEDIVRTIIFARDLGLKITVKNGGHSTYGQCLSNEAIAVDMVNFKKVEVDAIQKEVRLHSGALLGDLDDACAVSNLAVPSGDCPMVGITGLTLGGGNGYLSRTLGLTCDNLLSASMVTSEGKIIQLNKSNNSELFRALKGAGHCNFGVIVGMRLKLFDIPEKILGGSIWWPIDDAHEILRKYRDLMSSAPDQLTLYFRLNQSNAGLPMANVYGMYYGNISSGKTFFHQMLGWKSCYDQNISESTYYDMQKINLEPAPFSPRFFWKNFIIDELDDQLIEKLLQCYAMRPTAHCRVNLDPLGGRINKVNVEETAFIHRNSAFICSIIAVWINPSEKQICKKWCFDHWAQLSQSSRACYQNYADPFLDNGKAYFGDQLKTLLDLKKQVDHNNQFIGSLSI